MKKEAQERIEARRAEKKKRASQASPTAHVINCCGFETRQGDYFGVFDKKVQVTKEAWADENVPDNCPFPSKPCDDALIDQQYDTVKTACQGCVVKAEELQHETFKVVTESKFEGQFPGFFCLHTRNGCQQFTTMGATFRVLWLHVG